MSPEHGQQPSPWSGAHFATTHWSVVLAAGQDSSARSDAALAQLCEAYWYPLYAYVRRRGYGPEDSQDLTQSFFARLLEKNYIRQADRQRGKFRTFLLGALSHFLADEWDRSHRFKRGRAQTFISFDAATAEERYRLEPADTRDAATLFERHWAITLLERAVTRLEQEFTARGQGRLVLDLRAFLGGDQGDATYVEAAPALGLTPSAMKMAVSRNARPLPRAAPRRDRSNREQPPGNGRGISRAGGGAPGVSVTFFSFRLRNRCDRSCRCNHERQRDLSSMRPTSS